MSIDKSITSLFDRESFVYQVNSFDQKIDGFEGRWFLEKAHNALSTAFTKYFWIEQRNILMASNYVNEEKLKKLGILSKYIGYVDIYLYQYYLELMGLVDSLLKERNFDEAHRLINEMENIDYFIKEE